MENNKERVLAYSKAKMIGNDELAEISGGAGWNWTSFVTLGGSSSSGQGSEGHVDAHWDW